MIDMGMASAMTSVGRQLRRKNHSTITARIVPCTAADVALPVTRSTISPWSKMVTYCTSGGMEGLSSSSSFFTLFTVCSVLEPLCLVTMNTTPSLPFIRT